MINNTYYISDISSFEALIPYLRSGDSIVGYSLSRKDILYVKDISPADLGTPLDCCNHRIVSVNSFDEISYLYLHLDKLDGSINRVFLRKDDPDIIKVLYSLDIPFTISPELIHSSISSFELLKNLCLEKSSNKEIQPFGDIIHCVLDDSPFIPSTFNIKDGGYVYYLGRCLGNINEGDIVLKNRATLGIKCGECDYLKYCPCRISSEGCVLRNYSFPFLFDLFHKVSKFYKEEQCC